MEQFYYVFDTEDELSSYDENVVSFYIVKQSYFDETGYIDDLHIDDIVYASIPEEQREQFEERIWECMESVFETEMSKDDLITYLESFPNFKEAVLSD